MKISVDPTSLTSLHVGPTYWGYIYVYATGATNSPEKVTVTLQKPW